MEAEAPPQNSSSKESCKKWGSRELRTQSNITDLEFAESNLDHLPVLFTMVPNGINRDHSAGKSTRAKEAKFHADY